MAVIDFTKVENLVFEGGGGKGVVYLGVVKALESQGILPIEIDKYEIITDTLPYSLAGESYNPGSDVKIRRIAGSSAGAITAFMLAMGGTAKDIANELKNTQQFIEFFDLPKQISRNHRDGTDIPKSKQAIREVAYQSGTLNNKANDHKQTSPLKGTEIEVDNKWQTKQDPFEIPDAAFSLFSWYFDLKEVIKSDNILRAILNRDLTADEWENYKQMGRTYAPAPYDNGAREIADSDKTKSAIRDNYVTHLQLTGGLFPGRQVRLFFHRLILRHLFRIDNTMINLMLKQHTRTAQENQSVRNYIDANFFDSKSNTRIARFMQIKSAVTGVTILRAQPINTFIDLLVNINFREFFYITRVDVSFTGTNVTRRVPRIFSQAYSPLMPVCEAAAISMNIPILFSPVILRGNIMDNPQYQALLSASEVSETTKKRWTYSKYNQYYKGAYADGGMINNYPIQLMRNEARVAFAEFIVPEIRRKRSGSSSINKSLGFRLTDWPHVANTDDNTELQNHLSLLPYLGNVVSSLQFFSEEGQLTDYNDHQVTLDIGVGDVGTLDFSPSRTKASGPITQAFWTTVFKIKGTPDDAAVRYSLAAELKKYTDELTELVNLLPK